MSTGKETEPAMRTTRESEIFRDPPGSGNYSSSIGAAQGIELFSGSSRVRRSRPSKTIFEPARQIPVFAETDVLVVGGGPAGTAAAIAADRLGAEVLLVERYNHLGGREMLVYLTKHPEAFDPESITILAEALDIAWATVRASSSRFDGRDEDARDAIARHIVDLAKLG